MKLDVCVFTHNPRLQIFEKVLKSLGRQTLSREKFHVWVIDNASSPPLGSVELRPLEDAGVPYTLLQEHKLGLAHARVKAIESTQSEWLVFVDDDNELFDDYLETVRDIALKNPQLGCFGGKLLLAEGIHVPQWMVPMLPFLAIKDCGDEVISNCVDQWGLWEPPGAGAVIRRPVLDLYIARTREFQESTRLGRRGKKGLMSAEDSLMMRGAFKLKLQCAYQPRLRLWHHIDTNRLNFKYMVRLMYNFGRSQVVLERALGNHIPKPKFKQFRRLITNFPKHREKIARLAWQWGYFFESRREPSSTASPASTAAKPLPETTVKS